MSCTVPGCESKSAVHPPMHEGMHWSDCDYEPMCSYHEQELELIGLIEETVVRQMFPDTWVDLLYGDERPKMQFPATPLMLVLP